MDFITDSYQVFSTTWVPKKIKKILISIRKFKGGNSCSCKKICLWCLRGKFGIRMEYLWSLKKKFGFSVEHSSPNRNQNQPTMLNFLCNTNNTYRFLYVYQICGNCLRSRVKVFLNSPTLFILALIQWWLQIARVPYNQMYFVTAFSELQQTLLYSAEMFWKPQ